MTLMSYDVQRCVETCQKHVTLSSFDPIRQYMEQLHFDGNAAVVANCFGHKIVAV